MLPTRWSHLIRYGLLGTSLVTPAVAHADACDDVADWTVTLLVGAQFSPKLKLVGGAEVRGCVNDKTEAFGRFELGGAPARFIAGARVRPFESWDRDDDLELLGVEAGGIFDTQTKFGFHLAATFGTHSAYAALQAQARLTDTDEPTRFTLLGGLAPWTAFMQDRAVVGRPLTAGSHFLTPRVARRLIALRSAEARAVRAHYVASARLELSSVWTFMRLAAELVAVGAPLELVAQALDAADDEVRHAAMCARAAGGISLAALPAEVARPRFSKRSPEALATLAIEAWCEGCINETAASEEARLAAEAASGERREMLTTIARDEAGHADLAWAVLAWLFEVDADTTSRALAKIPPVESLPTPEIDPALAREGVPTAEVTQAALAYARRVARERIQIARPACV